MLSSEQGNPFEERVTVLLFEPTVGHEISQTKPLNDTITWERRGCLLMHPSHHLHVCPKPDAARMDNLTNIYSPTRTRPK